MSDEVVERLARTHVDAHLDQLREVLGGRAADRHEEMRMAASGIEEHRPDGAERVEDELRRALDDAVNAFERGAMRFVHEPERAADSKIDRALDERGSSSI